MKEVLYGVLCFVPEHIPLTLRSFEHDLQHHAGVKPVRQYYSTAADLRLTHRHFVEPSSTSSDHHLGKPNKSSASRRINPHQHRHPMDYTERAYQHRRTVASSSRHRPRHDLHRQGRTIASSSWYPSRRPTSTHRLTSRLRHLGWTGGFAISSSTYSGHFDVASRPAPSR